MIAADEEAAAVTARPLGADEVRTAYDRLGRKAASTAPRGMARTFSRAAAGRLAFDAATTLPSGVDGTVRRITYRYYGAEQSVTGLTRDGPPDNAMNFTFTGFPPGRARRSTALGSHVGLPLQWPDAGYVSCSQRH